MPEARAFCARRAISSSTFLPTTIIRSASSSMITTTIRQRLEIRDRALIDAGIVGGALQQHRIANRLVLGVRVFDASVVAGDVAHAQRRHQLVAPLHLGDAPAQRIGRLLHVGDDRREQVRNALVDRQLQHLRIDHDQAHVLGGRTCTAGYSIMALIATDLPEPVVPATSRCGMRARSATIGRAADVLAERQRQRRVRPHRRPWT